MTRAGSFLVLLLGLAGAAGVIAWFLLVPKEPPPKAGRPPFSVPVTLAALEARDLAPAVALTGDVRTSARAHVGFLVAGRVKAVAAQEGDLVEAGAPLASLEDGDQRVRLALADAGVEWAKRRLDLLLAGSREEERGRLEATLRAAEAELEYAANEVERGRPLVESQVISPGELDRLVAARDAARGRRDAAAKQLQEARAGTRPEDVEVQRAEVRLKEAERDVAQRELEKTVLAAPLRSHVVRRSVAPGDQVAAGEPLFELVDVNHREIVLDVPARDAARLGDAPRARITIDVDPSFRLETAVDAVIAAAEEPSRNFRAIVRLDPSEDPAHVLKPGHFVRAEVTLRPLPRAFVVPADAVRTTPRGTVVVRAVPAPAASGAPPAGGPPGPPPPPFVAEWVPVRVLGEDPSGTAVESLGPPLAVGDRIVVTGSDLAFPGVPLRPAPTASGPGTPPGAPGAAPGARP